MPLLFLKSEGIEKECNRTKYSNNTENEHDKINFLNVFKMAFYLRDLRNKAVQIFNSLNL